MNSQEDVSNRLVRFLDNLPNGNDKTLIVLKGHLLIEELMTEILKLKIEGNPLGLAVQKRWMFNKKLELCWALVKDELEPGLWDSIKKLNGVRNDMSHQLQPNNIDKKIEEFIISVRGFSLMPDEPDLNLHYSLGWLYILLNSYLNRIKST